MEKKDNVRISDAGRMFNPAVLASYPDKIKSLPFCVWRMEQREGKPTKVPYNPANGKKASVSRLDTFSSFEKAIDAAGDYDGVGLAISGDVGCIDLDGCVADDAVLTDDGIITGESNLTDASALTDDAAKVVSIMDGAFMEYSPSGRGLHLYFTVPKEFRFEQDQYYINNRTYGFEIYIPGATNRYLTVTGNVYRAGDMGVTAEALQEFLDTFMRKPGMPAPAPLPEGGSVLSDGEVLYMAGHSKSGEKFMGCFSGRWQEYGKSSTDAADSTDNDDKPWTQSQADMSVCQHLAFYCRGDMGQMDRIFRTSGLMREKWDRRAGQCTYGEMTMRNAISKCTAFYDPAYNHTDPEDDFADLGEAAAPAQADEIDRYLESELTREAALSDGFLALAAWAYENDELRYSLIREAVPKSVGVRLFEHGMKRFLGRNRKGKQALQLLSLKGRPTPGMVAPQDWIVNDKGVWHMEPVMGEMVPTRICAEPLYVSAKMENVDDDTEKLEISFKRNGRWKSIVAPRQDMVNRNNIIRYADYGFPVSSGTAPTVTRFIAEMEAANGTVIPRKKSIKRAGWIGDEFFPYYLKNAVLYQDEDANTEKLLVALRPEGDKEKWLEAGMKVRTMPFARAMLAASFASPLLEKLQQRVIYLHIWYESRSGKTAALKYGLSVWGDPSVLLGTYNATIVGMERRAGVMKHLPYALDELQCLNQKKMSINEIVYNLGNGYGRTRGKVGSGIRKAEDWRNCILSTGEQPISTERSMDGVNTRLMEIYGRPVDTEEFGKELHQISEKNFGYAGSDYIRYIVEKVLGDKGRMKEDYNSLRAAICTGDNSVRLDNAATLALADYYSAVSVFGIGPQEAWEAAVDFGRLLFGTLKESEPQESIDAAWDFVTGWAAANKAKFITASSLFEPSPIYGKIESGKVYAIASYLNEALDNAGFAHAKCVKGFVRKGYIGGFTDSQGKNRSQVGKSIKGIVTRVYVLNLNIPDGVGDDDAVLSEPDILPMV